jgi:PST family polysaccharide transporter
VIGMSTLFMGLVVLVSEFGLGTAVMVSTDLTTHKIRQLNTFAVITGAGGTLLAVFITPFMAVFFRTPPLKAIVPVMGIGFTLSSFRIVPQGILLKEIRFKLVSIIETFQALSQTASTLLLAAAGARYWSIVIGGLVGAAVSSAIFGLARPCGFAKPSWQIRKELSFSWRLLVSNVASYVCSNSDFAVAGRRLGEMALGHYTMAWNIGNLPCDRLTSLVTRVTPSLFAAVQHDHAELRRYLRVLIEGMSVIAFPVAFGLALVAPSLTTAVFDPRWRALAIPLRFLALSVAFRAITPILSQALLFVNDMDFVMWQTLALAVIQPASFLYASRWGIDGIAAAWLYVACPLMVGSVFLRVGWKAGMSLVEFYQGLKPASIASFAMIAIVLAEDWLLPPSTSPLVRLATEPVSGALVYLGVLVVFFRPRLDALWRLVRNRDAGTTATP